MLLSYFPPKSEKFTKFQHFGFVRTSLNVFNVDSTGDKN